MAIFPVLEIEDRLQINDKTRFSATKSFVTTGSTAIASVQFKPGKNGTPITITSASSSAWYLDYQFASFTIDVDADNNKIDFSEGAGELTATLTSGEYSLADLAAEIEAQLTAAGSWVYTVSVDTDNKMTIAATGGFSLLAITGTHRLNSIYPDIGFPIADDKIGILQIEDSTGKATYTGDYIESVNKKITITVSDGTASQSQSKTMAIYSMIGDHLFSDDSQLMSHEDDILKYVRSGRSSFLDKHRLAQDHIMDEFDRMGKNDIYWERLTKHAVVDIQEVSEWSKFHVLKIIFEALSNTVDDIFSVKAKKYDALASTKRDRALLRLDRNKDGKVGIEEFESIRSVTLVRQ